MDIAQRIRRSAQAVWAVLREPPVFPPGHFYSPHTNRTDRDRALDWRSRSVAGIDLRAEEQLALARLLAPAMAEFQEGARYVSDPDLNSQFGPQDAATLHAILRFVRPSRYLEIGSGFSTAVALDTVESHLPDLSITCVEPYPERLRSRLRPQDQVELMESLAQDVPMDVFRQLGADDVLFIDSTHVVKSGSDVVYLLLHVLPVLRDGVIVHVHDVHWPFEYHPRWIAEGRDWNEVYLVRALLTENRRLNIMLMTSWLWGAHPEVIPELLRRDPLGTGSLWMRVGG